MSPPPFALSSGALLLLLSCSGLVVPVSTPPAGELNGAGGSDAGPQLEQAATGAVSIRWSEPGPIDVLCAVEAPYPGPEERVASAQLGGTFTDGSADAGTVYAYRVERAGRPPNRRRRRLLHRPPRQHAQPPVLRDRLLAGGWTKVNAAPVAGQSFTFELPATRPGCALAGCAPTAATATGSHVYLFIRAVSLAGEEGFLTDVFSPTDARFVP